MAVTLRARPKIISKSVKQVEQLLKGNEVMIMTRQKLYPPCSMQNANTLLTRKKLVPFWPKLVSENYVCRGLGKSRFGKEKFFV